MILSLAFLFIKAAEAIIKLYGLPDKIEIRLTFKKNKKVSRKTNR